LQEAGVAASVVSQGQDLYASEHLKSREFYRESKYYTAERGKSASEWEEGSSLSWSMPAHLSATPMEFGDYSNIGEDNPYVFGQLLGLPDDQLAGLVADGVVY
ncbi:MAG: hypothetical protein ACE1ZZ_03995, partial [Dehalococcoidia bacterium]